MLLLLIATLCVSLTVGRVVNGELKWINGEEETIQWPVKYTIKATKLSLTSNLIEDFVIWKTNESSRMEVNHGAVKFFTYAVAGADDSDNNFVKYEIHPETDNKENVENVCTTLDDPFESYSPELDDILPDVTYSNYKAIRNETIGDRLAIRFEYTDRYYPDEDEFYILWAINDYKIGNGKTAWVPIRYEVKEYNTQLEALTKHEVWEFNDFGIKFDEIEMFDAESYGCGIEKVVKVTSASEAVTNELMFINTEKKHHVDYVFNSFKKKFNRKYAHEEEHNIRRNIFKQNMRLISSTNRQNLTYKLGVNQFADKTPEELKKTANLWRRPKGKFGNIAFPYTEQALKDIDDKLPTSFDHRLNGLVTPVKDQGECGCCWTFGTTAAMEGALAKANDGRLLRLSNQALVDCAWGFGAGGCGGGTYSAAYEWMMAYGLPTEEEYGPYLNQLVETLTYYFSENRKKIHVVLKQDGNCHITNMTKYPIHGYTDVTPYSISALKVALFNHGPLTVAVEVTNKFGLYSRGIFYEKGCGSTGLNHEVSLIGYGHQNGELFWILKNSYGVNWGIDGFMLISAKNNNCGVTTEPTYIVL